MSWLLPIILATSVSVRAPNVQPNPFDYEIAFEIHKPEMMFMSRQWERELGKFYVDEEYWAMKTVEFDSLLVFVFKEKYVNKTSRSLEYNQFGLCLGHGGFSFGYALRHIDTEQNKMRPTHNLIVGFDIIKGINIPFLFGLNFTSNMEFVTNFSGYGINKSTRISAKILKGLNWFFLWKYDCLEVYNKATDKMNKIEDYQYKTGIEIEIPQFKKRNK